MKKFIFCLNEIYFKLRYLLINIFNKDMREQVANRMCKVLSTKDIYFAFQIKSRSNVYVPLVAGLNRCYSFAIVLQGPVCTKSNMTWDTVHFYQKVYPHAIIIISTWEDEPVEQFKEDENIVIIKNKKPLYSGIFNVNFQIVSSLAGVKKAKELGCLFAVKTRTDQRICKPYIFDSMIAALKFFPSVHKSQRGRVVALGMPEGGMFTPCFVCDYMYLGYTDDLIKLWSLPLDERTEGEHLRKITQSATRRWNSEQMLAPEIYIFKHYCIDILQLSCEDTIEFFWDAIRNYFICFGLKDVDLMWEKYGNMYNLNNITGMYYGRTDSSDRVATLNFDFFNWFNLYSGNVMYDKKFEKYADAVLVGGGDDKKCNNK